MILSVVFSGIFLQLPVSLDFEITSDHGICHIDGTRISSHLLSKKCSQELREIGSKE